MPIDSENKRRAAAGTPWAPIAPKPDGTIDAADRKQVIGVYPGITTAPATITGRCWNILDNLASTIGAMQTGGSVNSYDWAILDHIASTIGAL